MSNRLDRSVLTKIIPAAVAVAVAAAVAITGAATAATTTGNEHLSLINTQTNGSTPLHYSAIATGAFTAGGTAIVDSKAGTGTLRFQGGTIALKIKPGTTKSTGHPGCLLIETAPATYTIAGGTGIYKGITGSGKSKGTATFVGATVKGKCSNNTPADAIQIITRASGPVSLP
jgi:hypothetical protein